MKLIDLLARELRRWPEEAVIAVQDKNGIVKFSESQEVRMTRQGIWMRSGNIAFSKLCGIYPADDWESAIITRDEWLKMRDPR